MFINRHPLYDKFKHLRSGIYVIEGIIGAGKTTFGKSAENYLNNIGLECKFFPEYVNIDLLNQFIGDMKKYAYPFQMLMLFKRVETYKEAERYAKTGGISLIDRSIAGDMSFAKMHVQNGNITQEEWNTYINVIKKEVLPTPSACIYLQCNPENSINRIKHRGYSSEINGYSINYLDELSKTYSETIEDCKNVRNIVINWNISLIISDGELPNENVADILVKLI